MSKYQDEYPERADPGFLGFNFAAYAKVLDEMGSPRTAFWFYMNDELETFDEEAVTFQCLFGDDDEDGAVKAFLAKARPKKRVRAPQVTPVPGGTPKSTTAPAEAGSTKAVPAAPDAEKTALAET